MKTLLLVVQKFGNQKYGGVQTRLKNYLKYLPRQNIRPVVLSFENYPLPSRTAYRSISVYQYPKHDFQNIFFYLIRLMIREKVDFVHILEGTAGFAQLLTLFLANILGKKTGLSVYSGEWIDIVKRRKWQFGIKFICSSLLAGKIAANSRATASLLPKILKYKTSVVYPGVDITIAKKETASPFIQNQSPRILFVGRLFRRKGVDDLLLAVPALKKSFRNISLTIIGDQVETTQDVFWAEISRLQLQKYVKEEKPFYLTEIYKALVKKLKIESNVFFLSKVENLAPYYAFCDIVVLPAKEVVPVEGYEGFGNVFLEAGLFKKPVVGTYHFGIPEAVDDGKSGLLVPEASPEKLAWAIKKISQDKKYAKDLGENGYRRVTGNFSANHSTAQLINLYS